MDALQQGIITLIRSSLTQEGLSLPEGFDLEKAYPQILRHGILTMAYDGALRCGVDKKLPVMQKMFQGYLKCMMQSERQIHALNGLCGTFEGKGIDYLLLKGSILKLIYPKPELRQMGDADILIRDEQYCEIKPVMQQLGFVEDSTGPYDYTWDSPMLHVELHYRLASPADTDFLAYFGDGWQRAVGTVGKRCEYSKEDHLIYLVMHFAKHYRDSGIGLKHAADLWVYEKTYPDLDDKYLERELTKLRLWEFYCNVQRMLKLWFSGEKLDDKSAFITEVIFQSGAFGAHETFVVSTGVRAAKRSGSARRAKLQRTVDVVFPNYDAMVIRYPVLKKAPVLLPILWVARGFRVVFTQSEKIERQRKEIAAATPDKIETYQQALNYVGLDFHFKED